MLRPRLRRTRPRRRTALSAIGLSTSAPSSGRSTCGRDWTTSSFRTPSTRPWPMRCPARFGIPSTAPGTSWPSARQTTSSPIAAEELGADSLTRPWPLASAGDPGHRTADHRGRGGGTGSQRAGIARCPARRRRGGTPAGRRYRHLAGRLAVNGAGDRIRQGHRDSAAGHRSRPHEHRHRLHHHHVAGPDQVHPHRPDPDRRQVHRHHRTRPARRDVQRGLHRHAGPVDSRRRPGAQRIRRDRRTGLGGHPADQPGRPLARAVADYRRGKRCGTGYFTRRRLVDPPTVAAPDTRAAARRAAGDVRAPRRDPALGVGGTDRAGPQRRGARQRRGAPAARPPAGAGRPRRAAGVPAHLQPGCPRRGACHRRPCPGGEPVPCRRSRTPRRS